MHTKIVFAINRFLAYNFKNKQVRAMKCLPLESALNFDKDSINKTYRLGKFAKK